MHIPQDISALHMYHQHHYQRLYYSSILYPFLLWHTNNLCSPLWNETVAVSCKPPGSIQNEQVRHSLISHSRKKILCCFNKSRKCLMAIRSSFTSINAEKKKFYWRSAEKKKKKKWGGTRIWTGDLSICSRMLYHWAIPPRCVTKGKLALYNGARVCARAQWRLAPSSIYTPKFTFLSAFHKYRAQHSLYHQRAWPKWPDAAMNIIKKLWIFAM